MLIFSFDFYEKGCSLASNRRYKFEEMGGSGSKVGAVVGRAARTATGKGASSSKPGSVPPPFLHLPREDDALKNFKPTKGKHLRQYSTTVSERCSSVQYRP